MSDESSGIVRVTRLASEAFAFHRPVQAGRQHRRGAGDHSLAIVEGR